MNSRTRCQFLLSVVALVFPLLVSPATAQYMYLDSNGDGIHTAADAVNPSGPTTVDIWLDTAANRDGSAATCDVDPGQPLDFFAYGVALRASSGTIAWGTFTNRQTTLSFHFQRKESATEFVDGYGGQTGQPPSRYLLATLTLTIASGSPAIDIVPYTTILPGDYTMFGSHCYGLDFDDTLKLGSDWHDADGLPFGTTGSTNQPPVLNQPQDMTTATGEIALQEITASDPDHQPLTFAKAAGPPFLAVLTRDVGAGTATGTITLAPLLSDVGNATGAVSVTDGFATTQKEFQIEVTPGPNHTPHLDPIPSLIVVAGTTPRLLLHAADSDGQPLVFSKLSGPDYAEVSTLMSGSGGAVGSLRLTPGLCDTGPAAASLQVTDGVAAETIDFTITVKVRRAAPAQPPFVAAGRSTMVAAADINGDGHADILSGGVGEPLYTHLGHGDGTFAPPSTQPLGPNPSEPISAAFGDWNGDGRIDAALTVFGSDRLLVLFGSSAGTLGGPVYYSTPSLPWTIRSADLDQDGDLDLIFTHGGGVGILLGNGDGSFQPRSDYAISGSPRGMSLGDFNGDGRLDCAVACFTSKDVAIRFGVGGGLLGDASMLPVGNGTFDVVAADWNGDGRTDLAAGDIVLGVVHIFEGHGNGEFTAGAQIPGFDGFQRMEARDLNQDGNEDLVLAVSTILDATYVAYGNGDGTFQAKRMVLSAESGLATADFNEDGFPDVACTESFGPAIGSGSVRIWLNDAGGAGMPEARAFVESNAPAGGKPTICMRLEPIADSFRAQDVDFTSITLSPTDGGGSIQAVTTKTAVVGDTDGNGTAELPACFSKPDLAGLFPTEKGRQTVAAHLEGALVDGRRFCSSVSFEIIGTGKNLAASVSPNPLNPSGILRLTTSRDGFVRVRMFDLQGRVVRVLEDRAMVPAGAHDVRIDGRNTAGQTLASGVYFYEVETTEGSLKGRITVLK